MQLKRITLMNFKSYLGECTIGPFDEKFSAVIGPNGSGKSNLIESLLFVFGRRARSLRTDQLHHLIHNAVGYGEAWVEVVFTREGVEYKLKRVVSSTSVSKYLVNSAEVSYEHVCEWL
jgi:structural maintenance of chromosome 4